jgi:hypothetical protein
MIVAVKLNPESYKKIKDFVEKGTYGSVESFIEIAIANQILIETDGHGRFEANNESVTESNEEITQKVVQTKHHTGIQQYSQFLACPKEIPLPVLPPLSSTKETESFPLWGQINRLAPAKMVLRILANKILFQGSDRVDLKRFSADVAETTTSTRTYIEKRDKTNRIRGEELYVALPKKDPGSQQRFINFYIGRLPSGKWTDGILTGLGLARIELAEDGSVVIGLTEAGRKLACLPSPLIDELMLEEKQIENPFSVAEVEFLLDHLEVNKPGEFAYMLSVLRSIKEGARTPTALHRGVESFLRDKHLVVQISEKFVNTMQVGIIGRLVEMRLIKIKKDAQKSEYSVTDSGNALLAHEVKT